MDLLLRVLLLVVTLASVAAQLRTVRRVGTAGLAPSTWFALVTSTLFWLGYAIAIGDVTMISINVPALVIGLALVVALVRARAASYRGFAPYVAVPMVGWVAAFAFGATWVLGVGGTLLVVGRLLPQLWTAAVATDRSGISLGAWIGNGSNKVVWAGYGAVIGDSFVTWPSLVAAVVSFVVVALVVADRRRPRRPRTGRVVLRLPAPAGA